MFCPTGEASLCRLPAGKYAGCVTEVDTNEAGMDARVAELNKKFGEQTAIDVVAGGSKSLVVQSMIQESVRLLRARTA